jgi:hypothetical protein
MYTLIKSLSLLIIKSLSLLGAAAAMCGLVVWLIVVAGKERARVVSGTCPDYECIKKVFMRYDYPVHAGALSQIPVNAKDIRYYFHVHGSLFEVRFPFGEEEFIAWAESLGWNRDDILAHRNGGQAVIYDTDSRHSESVKFKSGFWLDSSRGTDECRNIAYDAESHTVYLQFWTPVPAKLKNRAL